MRPSCRADSPAAALGLVVAALAAWAGALGGPFQFDDWNIIVESPAVHSLAAWWASMPGIRPLLKLTYALDWLDGGGAYGFRLGNLLLHALNTLLVWRLVARWPGLAEAAPVAFWAALLFALHPVQGEVAAYIAGRSVGLMASFCLTGFLCWLRADETASPAWRAGALVAFGLALAVRETALVLPVALWIWLRAAGTPWGEGCRRLRPMWTIAALALLAFVALAGYRRLLGFSLDLASPLANLLRQPDAYADLLTRPLLRLETSIDPAPVRRTVGSAEWWAATAGIVAAVAAGFALLARRPLWGLALLWPFVWLLPTNSLLPRLDLVADRHLYLALVGPAVAVCAAAARLTPPWRSLFPAVLAGVLAVAAVRRTGDFASETALWTATARTSPGKARVWNNLGYGRLVEGDAAGAAAAFRKALVIDPGYARAAVNLGRAEAELAASKGRPGPP